MPIASGPTEELTTAVLDHGLHLGGRHLLERMPDQPLCEGRLPTDDVVEALPLEVVLDDGEASLNRVYCGEYGALMILVMPSASNSWAMSLLLWKLAPSRNSVNGCPPILVETSRQYPRNFQPSRLSV